MSYIIKSTSPFISIKLTEVGRRRLASGQLNFSHWAIGDSEINYTREQIVDGNQSNITLSGTSSLMRPFDHQPNIKSFITNAAGAHLNLLNSSNINVVKAVINNKATERGFFSGITSTQYDTQTGSTYIKSFGLIPNTSLVGGTVLNIPSSIIRSVGDFMMIKLVANATPSLADSIANNLTPLPYLWYKIQATDSVSVTVDRALPNQAAENSKSSQIFIYNGGEVANCFGSGTTTAYFDSGTLSFDSTSNVSCFSVPVWNMNNVYAENLAGMTGLTTTKLYEDFTKFGSYSYLGTMNPYLAYLSSSSAMTAVSSCDNTGLSYSDNISKGISILHYTNNTISNFYGEYLYVDTTVNKTVQITIPDIMYHRRGYATETGLFMGMQFIASGATQFIDGTDIEYNDLVEKQALIGTSKPLVVGRVYPQLKIVVLHDDEIISAISFKSNRNWTLPPLSANLSTPSGGTSVGLLASTKTVYLTYSLETQNSVGLMTSLLCQSYIKLDNNSVTAKDVSFRISEIDLLPYMHKKEKAGYNGTGFYAHKFKLVYQVVDNDSVRPNPANWKTYDFTSVAITNNSGETIDPIKLENQTPTINGFVLTSIVNSLAVQFDITNSLSMTPNNNTSILQFGDERFFYGNIETYIGATIYKTLFDLRINSGQFIKTTNLTRDTDLTNNPPNLKISEVGIYDSEGNLIIIGKVSTPISLIAGDTVMLELSLDF